VPPQVLSRTIEHRIAAFRIGEKGLSMRGGSDTQIHNACTTSPLPRRGMSCGGSRIFTAHKGALASRSRPLLRTQMRIGMLGLCKEITRMLGFWPIRIGARSTGSSDHNAETQPQEQTKPDKKRCAKSGKSHKALISHRSPKSGRFPGAPSPPKGLLWNENFTIPRSAHFPQRIWRYPPR
jgi:hypothetical protein